MNTELLGLAPDGEVRRVVVIHESLPQARDCLLGAGLPPDLGPGIRSITNQTEKKRCLKAVIKYSRAGVN